MKLEEIGFYTLSDERAMHASETSPIWRGEVIVTGRCNFDCVYCRRLPPRDMDENLALTVIEQWLGDGLKNVRFSGGEPTLYRHLPLLVRGCRVGGVERIGISSNGASPLYIYEGLIQDGVNDIAISLDACYSSLADNIARVNGQWEKVTATIRKLSGMTYVTASIVLSSENVGQANEIVSLANDLGVADIRFVTASHDDELALKMQDIPSAFLDQYPMLRYRVENLRVGRRIRGLRPTDSHKCYLVLDDSVIAGKWHYPCGVYLREGGLPIGEVGPCMRRQRAEWMLAKDIHTDEICRQFCSDLYVDYNNKFEEFIRERNDWTLAEYQGPIKVNDFA
ncbi:GTP 3',8-cyclase [Anaerolineales bacterium]|nr:GTP 3',8-cyclase [Anaerolineales bacterium]